MADVPEIPEWLAREISEVIRRWPQGQVALNWAEHRVQSRDIRTHGAVKQEKITRREPVA